jgi:predicted HicB family RNase H-like nuclease
MMPTPSNGATVPHGRPLLEQWCADRQVDIDRILSRRRDWLTVQDRQDAMVYLQSAGMSSVAIGRLFGRDHSTVLHAISRAKARPQQPPDQKWCPRCTSWKNRSAFGANRAKGDGLASYCRDCARTMLDEARRARGMKRMPKKPDNVQFNVKLDPKLATAVKLTADELGISRSELAARALTRELQRLWRACMRCHERPRIDGDTRCGQCIAAAIREAS